MNRFWLSLAAFYVFLLAFVACVLAADVFGWPHATMSRAAAAFAVALIACGAWLNREAGRRS